MAGLAALAIISIVAKPAPPGTGAVIIKALSAIEEPDKITYYKIVTRSLGRAGGGGRSSEVTEHWVDYENETQKIISTSSRAGDVFATLTKDGKTIGIEGYGGRVDVSENRALKPFSDRLKDEIKNYRAWLKEGARRLGDETIGGIKTYKIRWAAPLEDIGRVDGRRMKLVFTMNVRQDNFYPVRLVDERYLVDAAGRSELDGGSIQTVQEIKLIDRSNRIAGFFTLDIPKDAPYRRNYGYTLKEARDFRDFDLYYLGESFEQFKFYGGFQYESERNTPYPPAGWPREMVRLEYSNPTEDGVSLLIWPKFDLGIILGASYPGAKTTAVDINGEPAMLVEKNWGRVITRVLLMERGRSTMMIKAKDKDMLIKAAAALIKVN